jgi:hypothetical protein
MAMKIGLHLRKHGISLVSSAPIERAFRELEVYGYQFVKEGYDILFINLSFFPKGFMFEDFLKELNSDVPIIIYDERVSAGRLPFWHLNHQRVIGFMKTSLLKDKHLYKFRYPNASYHYHLMDQIYNDNKKEPSFRPYLNNSMFYKVHLGWNLGLHGFFVDTKPNFESDRPIDIHFSIVTKPFFEDHEYYILHRNHFVKEVDRIVSKYNFTASGQCGRRRMVPTAKLKVDNKYHSLMRRSKICISPFGDGEICWRDFEAIVNGAILVKPDMSYINTWPDVYKPMETYIPIKLDLSDLEEVIFRVTNNYSKYKYITINAYKALKKSFSNQVFALRFDRIVKDILRKENSEYGRNY